MKPRICTVVTGKTLEEFLINLDAAQQLSDLVELRADTISDIDIQIVEVIHNKINREAIFTCRSDKEGGKFMQSEVNRLKIINHAITLGFPLIDIEYETMQTTPIDRNKSQLILSYHNFAETPPYWQLTKLIFQMRQLKPDIIKIATMVQSDYDIQKLWRVLLSKKPEEKQIIIGMGEKGRITRILGPYLGSYLTYGSIGLSESAPGQLSVETLNEFYTAFDAAL